MTATFLDKPKFAKRHLRGLILSNYIAVIKRDYPDFDVESFFNSYKLRPSELKNEYSWTSVSTNVAVSMTLIRLIGDSQLSRKAGWYGISREGLGPTLYLLGRYFIPLKSIYLRLPQFVALMNKLIKCEVVVTKAGSYLFSVRPVFTDLNEDEKRDLLQLFPVIISNMQGYFEAVPRLKGLPLAKSSVVLEEQDGVNIASIHINCSIRTDAVHAFYRFAPLFFAIASFGFLFMVGVGTIYSALFATVIFLALTCIQLWLKMSAIAELAEQSEISLIEIDQSNKRLAEREQNIIDLSQALSAAKSKHSELSVRKDTYNSIRQLAHDIRSPLSALNLATQTIKENNSDAAEIIIQSSKRISNIADSVLKTSAAQLSQHTATASTDVQVSVNKIINEKRLRLLNRDHEFEISLPEKTMAQIDSVAFERIMSNLIDNAIEACDSAPHVKVYIRSQSSNFCDLVVEDNGKGFPPTVIEKLGTYGNTSGKARGNGLGLAYAFNVVHSLGGELLVESLRHPTRIILKLPNTET